MPASAPLDAPCDAPLDAPLDAPVDAAICAALARARACAAAAHPDVRSDGARFDAHLVAQAGEGEPAAVAAAIDALCCDDVWLACAAVWGDKAATARIDALLQDAAARVRSTWDYDEVAQYLRVDAFIGAGGTPGLLRYKGRGKLSSWLRVAAGRFAVGQAQRRRREVSLSALDPHRGLAHAQGPELRALVREHQPALKKAVAAAFGALDPEARDLLWRVYVAGASVDVLGGALGVHRATAARRVARARAALLAGMLEQAEGLPVRINDADLDELLIAAWRELSQSLATLTQHA